MSLLSKLNTLLFGPEFRNIAPATGWVYHAPTLTSDDRYWANRWIVSAFASDRNGRTVGLVSKTGPDHLGAFVDATTLAQGTFMTKAQSDQILVGLNLRNEGARTPFEMLDGSFPSLDMNRTLRQVTFPVPADLEYPEPLR